MRNVSVANKRESDRTRQFLTAPLQEMLNKRKSTGEIDRVVVQGRRDVRGLDGYNEGQISLERFLEIGWPFRVCDISLKVLSAADSSSDSLCWRAFQTVKKVLKEYLNE